MSTVLVKVRYSGGGYIARAGRGKKATSGSSTDRESTACQRAAAKYFGLSEGNVQTAHDVQLEIVTQSPVVYRASLPNRALNSQPSTLNSPGGAS